VSTRDYLSYSAMSTYQTCPLKYYFRYVANIPDETVSESLIFGSALHRALETYYRMTMEGEELVDLRPLLESFQLEYSLRLSTATQSPVVIEDLNEHLELARKILNAFLSEEMPLSCKSVLGMEEEFRCKVSEHAPDLFGRLDLLAMDHTGRNACIVDFKTSRSRWSDADLLRSKDQLLLTSLAVKEKYGIENLRLYFVVMTKTKSPSVEVLNVPLCSQSTSRSIKTFESVWRAIDSKNFYPAPSAMGCACCPYRQPCNFWPREWTPTVSIADMTDSAINHLEGRTVDLAS
jgi:putative RecB family exonuclease